MSNNEQMKQFENLIKKAWEYENFKKQLLTNAKEAIEKETGHKIPDSIKITIHENKPNDMHFILPANPNKKELSDDELESVAGGSKDCYNQTWQLTSNDPANVLAGGLLGGLFSATGCTWLWGAPGSEL